MWPNKRISMRPNRPEPITEKCYWTLKKCPEVSEIYYFVFANARALVLVTVLDHDISASNTDMASNQFNWLTQLLQCIPIEVENSPNSSILKLISLFHFTISSAKFFSFRYSCNDVCKSGDDSWDYVGCRWFEYDWFGWICILQHRFIFRVSLVPQTVSSGSSAQN